MGLFSSRPELNNTWAAIPGEPLDDGGTPSLDVAAPTTALGLTPESGTAITIDLTSFSAPTGSEGTADAD